MFNFSILATEAPVNAPLQLVPEVGVRLLAKGIDKGGPGSIEQHLEADILIQAEAILPAAVSITGPN